MNVKWTEASAAAISTTEALVEKYHPQLREARIGLVFRSEAATSQGLEVWAKASKVDDKTRALLEANGAEAVDLLIWIAEDVWMRLNEEQRHALIDHELCHFQLGGDGYRMVGHDVEEFEVILERYGLWNHNLLKAKKVLQQAVQPTLFEVSHLSRLGAVVSVQPETMPAEG